jgi:hypothetical protein
MFSREGVQGPARGVDLAGGGVSFQFRHNQLVRSTQYKKLDMAAPGANSGKNRVSMTSQQNRKRRQRRLHVRDDMPL